MNIKFDGDYSKLTPEQYKQVQALMCTPLKDVPERAKEIASAYGKRMGLCGEVYACEYSEYINELNN